MSVKKDVLLIMAVAAILFIPFLGNVRLFDWDEINFAECAREMLTTGDYLRVQIDYSPFWEKPPLFIWLQASLMSIFGVNEFAARLPNALIGIITLPLLFLWGKHIRSRRFGYLWVASYCGSFLPYLYFRSAIIDPLFNLLIFSGIMTLAIGKEDKKLRNSALAGILIGLAMLTKGPVALLVSSTAMLIVMSIVFFKQNAYSSVTENTIQHSALQRKFFQIYGKYLISSLPFWAVFLICSLLTAGLWFGIDILRNGTWFVSEFIRYQIRLLTTGDAGHSGPFYYHFIVLLFGCFPASVFALWSFFTAEKNYSFKIVRLWNIVLLIVVLAIFSIVKTKIVHYSSLCYFPIAFLAANWLDEILSGTIKWKKIHSAIVGIFGILWALAFSAIPVIGLFKDNLLPFINDEFARANLTAPVQWGKWETTIGITFGFAIIVSLFLPNRSKIIVLFASTVISSWLFLPIIAPKIEGYTQASAVEFYQSLQDKDCYVKPVGFKSYAHLFYTKKPRCLAPSSLDILPDDFENWLFDGDIDKPAYFVCKMQDAHICRQHKNIHEIGEKAGFVFFWRVPDTNR